MTSSRLPGKVLKPILGRPMLALLLERLRRASTLDMIIVAMTQREEDDPLQAFCDEAGVASYRGDENDVLGRFHHALASRAPGAQTVVRITSDCPLLDPEIVDNQVSYFLNNRDRFDYVSVGKAPKLPNGASVEVFSRGALERAFSEATQAYDREHVTPFIQAPDHGFHLGVTPTDILAPEARLSVDTEADFEVVRLIFEALYPANPAFSLADVLHYLEAHPEVAAINSDVVQTTGPYATS